MLINLRNALMAGKRLPYDAEIEFLESTGTQWIDTGIVGDNTVTFTGLVYRTSNASNECAVGSLSASFTRCWLSYFYVGKYRLGYGRLYSDPTTAPIGEWLYQELKHESGNANLYANGVVVASVPIETFTTGLNMYIGAMNSAGSASYTFKGKIAGIQIYKSGVLVRDFIPVRKGTVGYLYDRVTRKLFGNAGTGDFVLGPDVVPVEWLGSGANTYINTGIIPDDTYGMEVTGYTTQTNDSAWIGTRNSSNQRCFMGYSPSLGFYYGWNGRQDIQYTTGVWSTASMNLYNSRKNMMDGTEVGSIAETLGAQNRAIYLFGLTANGTLRLKLKSALITKGSDDVLKLVSVRVGTDATSWEGAMIDTLTRRIYRNAGTGAFTYGNDLKYPIPAE